MCGRELFLRVNYTLTFSIGIICGPVPYVTLLLRQENLNLTTSPSCWNWSPKSRICRPSHLFLHHKKLFLVKPQTSPAFQMALLSLGPFLEQAQMEVIRPAEMHVWPRCYIFWFSPQESSMIQQYLFSIMYIFFLKIREKMSESRIKGK